MSGSFLGLFAALHWQRRRETALAAVFACALAVLVSGCVSSTVVTQQPVSQTSEVTRPELVTASDESPGRRRARIRIELASGYFETDKPTVALDEVKQAIAADPNYAPAYSLRGLIYMRLNDFDLAAESFRRATTLNPRDADTLHNHGWLMCQQKRFEEADRLFSQAATTPGYTNLPKTLMAQGLCRVRWGRPAEAETTLTRAYDLDPGNPIVGYTLANMHFQRGDMAGSRFYIRRVNNGEFATAESLWLGMRVERRLGDNVALSQLGEQLRKRFPQSREAASFERGVFDE
ncbi:type IV pilus biogenesis/stability protein PilW [Xylophilus sp. GOD-11R]|uniref:type IV pilus biogenesis/stability protein PilW n=1 Tax=Xylophilus sp. GOD-11R TaxID=3089814 RepID=UPI00298C366E|nr:type IV pilus biogenesis/stability protein PilW [Xylophilus sp. GOD-11R]WPB55092.1 type IV pilus biogenesis/stability protein PilW [Xylophilus sp. GOD-11R]